MECPSLVFRDYYREHWNEEKRIHFLASIELFVVSPIEIELQVEGLHENGQIDGTWTQAIVKIKYSPNTNLYDVIKTILDKITYDYQYKLTNASYKDLILCSNTLVEKHPEKCNDGNGTYMGCKWMEFCPENIQYVEYFKEFYEKNGWHDDLDEFNIIYGEVTYNQDENKYDFVYDYPIVSKDMPKEYYEITRGRNVWDIEYDSDTDTYYVDPKNYS
jgi:hypothetical protein